MECPQCPSNTYSFPGSSSCVACPHATVNPGGEERCSYDCSRLQEYILADEPTDSTGPVYDISALTTRSYTISNEMDPELFFNLNLCTPRMTSCSPNPTFACLYNESGPISDLGNTIGFYAQPTGYQGVLITLSNPTTGCSANVSLVCAPFNSSAPPDIPFYSHGSDPKACAYYFALVTNLACPLCRASDYFAVVSPCMNEVTTVSYHWDTHRLCHGGVSLPPNSYSVCSSSEETVPIKESTIIGIVLGVGAVVILAGAGLAYLFVRNRKTEAKYATLLGGGRQMTSLNSVESEAPGSPPTHSIGN